MNKLDLENLRSCPAELVLPVIADYAKLDLSFTPLKNSGSTRWHASVRGKDFELVLTGFKFWDTHAEIGGGGAVDLTMHLTGLNFKHAVNELQKALPFAFRSRRKVES